MSLFAWIRLHRKTAAKAYGEADTSVSMFENPEARLAALKTKREVLSCVEMVGAEMVVSPTIM